MKSDFVTFFGDPDQNRQRSYQSGAALIFAYANTEISRTKGDLSEILKRNGGLAVQVDTSTLATQVQVSLNPSYQPPGKLLKLSVDDRAKWVDVPKNFQLERGDHLLVPVDQKSQESLNDLYKNLKYLPADYEEIFLNSIRRPSLEWRMARLEAVEGLARPAKKAAGNEGDQVRDHVIAEQGSWLNNWLNKRWVVAGLMLLLIAVSGAGGFGLRGYLNPSTKNSSMIAFDQRPPSPSDAGISLVYKVKVTGVHSSETPTGAVTLLVDGKEGASVQLDSGQAEFSEPLAKGEYKIKAKYSGDSQFDISESPEISQIVRAKPVPNGEPTKPAVNLNLDPNATAVVGDTVTFNVSVTASSHSVPTGQVQILVQKNRIYSPLGSEVPSLDSSGSTSLTTTDLPVGKYRFVARYLTNNSSVFQNSDSKPASFTVAKNGTPTHKPKGGGSPGPATPRATPTPTPTVTSAPTPTPTTKTTPTTVPTPTPTPTPIPTPVPPPVPTATPTPPLKPAATPSKPAPTPTPQPEGKFGKS